MGPTSTSFSEPVSKPAQGEELLLSAWPALSQAKSGKGSDGRSVETGLWLAPGIIRLVRRLPISLPAHSELLDGITPMANDW